MAYNENLADRIRQFYTSKSILYIEKKMFGGLCFMVNHKMCVGIVKDELMARVGPEHYAICLKRKHCTQMNFTGQPMKGYVFVQDQGIDLDADLYYYLDLALAFNPKAKSSKKKS